MSSTYHTSIFFGSSSWKSQMRCFFTHEWQRIRYVFTYFLLIHSMFGNFCSLSSYDLFICRYLQPILTLGHVWQNVQPRGARKNFCVEGQLVVSLWLSVPLGWNACMCIYKLDHTSLRWLLAVGSAPFYYMYQFWLLIQRTHLMTFEWNSVKEQFLNMSEKCPPFSQCH